MRRRAGVYLIGSHEHGWYKIGRSNNPKMRLNTLQTACPFALELIRFAVPNCGAKQVESRLHHLFSDNRIRGEWFSLNQDEVGEAVYALHHSGLARRMKGVISMPQLPVNPNGLDEQQPISHMTVQ